MSERVRENPLNDSLADIVLAQGSERHRFVLSHSRPTGSGNGRSLADIVHHLAILHGRHPGLGEAMAQRQLHREIEGWQSDVLQALAEERGYLTRLVVAVGPIPSTPRAAECEAQLNARRHAIDMLAQSDRLGCTLGALAGLALDWPTLRDMLDAAAQRFGIEPPPCRLPARSGTLSALAAADPDRALDRAIGFGARQLLLQHHALWDLLQAREASRRDI